MGTPKAAVVLDGRTMIERVALAMRQAGADPLLQIGGDEAWADLIGAVWVADRWPGEGPLAGLATGVDAAAGLVGQAALTDGMVLVVPCDQPWLTAASLLQLVGRLRARPDAESAAPVDGDGRAVPFPSVHRCRNAARLIALVDGGARRADAFHQLGPVAEAAMSARELRDVDSPADLDPAS